LEAVSSVKTLLPNSGGRVGVDHVSVDRRMMIFQWLAVLAVGRNDRCLCNPVLSRKFPIGP